MIKVNLLRPNYLEKYIRQVEKYRFYFVCRLGDKVCERLDRTDLPYIIDMKKDSIVVPLPKNKRLEMFDELSRYLKLMKRNGNSRAREASKDEVRAIKYLLGHGYFGADKILPSSDNFPLDE